MFRLRLVDVLTTPRQSIRIAGLAALALGAITGACSENPTPGPDLSIPATFVAKVACSGHFVAGLSAAHVDEDLERFAGLGLTWTVDPAAERVAVHAPDGTVWGRAVYRSGLGCTILNADSTLVLAAAGSPSPRPTPGAPPPPDPRSEDVDRPRLDATIDSAFQEPDPDEPRGTRAVVVLREGRILAERYADGIGPDTRLRGWSMAKSVTAALVGVLIEDGSLGLFDALPVPEWEPGDPRRAITLMQMLEMSSGLGFVEDYDGTATDPAVMLFSASDAGGYAAAKPLVEDPGVTYRYSSGTTNIISRALRHVVEARGEDYWTFPHRRLFGPIGAISFVLEPDPSGTFVGSSYAWATARDWGRLGQLFLQNGMWDDRRILPDGWAGYVAEPTPTDPRGGFGAHFATNAGGRWPSLPRDLYLMSGLDGQYVFIAPSHGTVVVRLGQTPGDGFDPEAFMGGVLEALPPRTPPTVAPAPPRGDTVDVLLVGNSYTYMHNLGDILEGIAAASSSGPLIEAELVVRGAARLAWHLETGTVSSALDRADRDVVVLQEQSRLLPVVDRMTADQLADTTQSVGPPGPFHEAVRGLVPRIRQHGARPVLFQTWARRGRPEQTRILADAYQDIGAELDVPVAPVGTAWAAADSLLQPSLYWFDGAHPGPAGSYLAALLLYDVIVGHPPQGPPSRIVGHPTTRPGSVDADRVAVLVDLPDGLARALQSIAREAVARRR